MAKIAKYKKILFSVFLLFLTTSFFSLFFHLRSPARLQDYLVEQVDKKLAARLSFESSAIVFRPFPLLQLNNARLEPIAEGIPTFAAPEARFSFQLFPLLWGRLRISGFQILDAKTVFNGANLEHIEFKTKGLNFKNPASFEGRGNWEGGEELFRGKGTVRYQDGGANFWRGLELHADLTLEAFSLGSEKIQKFFGKAPPLSLSGEFKGTLQLEKEREKDQILGLLQFQISHFQSQSAETFSPTGQARIIWNLGAQSFEVREILFKTPFGELQGSTVVKTETGEIEGARLSGRGIVLEELARHFPGFHSALPLEIGFSGQGEFDLTLQGQLDYLSLHTNLDLSTAVLAYGKIFSKPKDFPMEIVCDFILKRGELLSGDFSIRIREATIKGTLTDLNLKNGMGELTILTNKFNLKDWETLLVPFNHYEIGGLAKVLLNYKGNLIHLDQSMKVANLSLENVTLLTPQGKGIRQANAFIDFGPLSFRLKDARFQSGASSIQLDTELYNYEQGPQGTLRAQSPHLDFFSSLENIKGLRSVIQNEKILESLKKFEHTLKPYLPNPLVLEDVKLDVRAQQKKATIQNFKFRVWDGSFDLRGELDRASEEPKFWLEVGLDRLALARYFESFNRPGKNLEGNLFFTGRFEGSAISQKVFSESLTGRGNLSITNGEWQSLDLIGVLKTVEPFRKFDFQDTRTIPFHDLKASWSYQKGKFDTQDLLIHSDDLWIEGKGNLSREGILNSRLEVYLSEYLTERVFNFWKLGQDTGGKQLGPIPILLIGKLDNPELRVDEHEIETFLEAIRTRRPQKFLHKPFSELKRA